MAEPMTTMKIPVGLLDWLKEECERLCRAHEKHQTVCPAYKPDGHRNPAALNITPAMLVEMLLCARQRHRERRRAARRAKAERRVSKKSAENAGRVDR